MKTTSFLRSSVAIAASLLIAASPSFAATYYWGGGATNIGGTGTPEGGTGTWNTTIQNWTLNTYSGTGSGYVAWPNVNTNDAVFGGTAGTVTIGSSVTSGNIAVDTANYIFSLAATRTVTLTSLSGAGLSSSAFQATSNATLVFAGFGTTTYSGALNDAGGTLSFRLGSNRELSLTGTSSNYTGTTALYAGQLNISSIANGGTNSSIGASTSAASNLALGNSSGVATLNYVGSTASTDRLFTLTATSAGVSHKIQSNGSGPLNFTNTGAIAFGGTADITRGLTLGGANAGDNTLAATLGNNGTGAVSLTKADAGKWILTGNSSYTGTTTVSAGTLLVSGTLANTTALNVSGGKLQLGANNAINSTAALTLSGGTFDAQTFSNSLGALTLSGNSFIELNGGAIAFANSSAATWGAFTIDLTGFVSGSSLRFGTTNAGLTSTQLGQFTASGFNSFGLDTNGYLTAVPEPTTIVLVGIGLLALCWRSRARRIGTDS